MRKMTKGKWIAVFGIVASLALLSTGTYAYFAAEGPVGDRDITTGALGLKVCQGEGLLDADGEPKEELLNADGTLKQEQQDVMKDILPGAVKDYSAWVVNTGNQPVYLRVKVEKGVTGGAAAAGKALNGELLEVGAVSTGAWTLKDGYYYYTKDGGILAAGARTEPLFSTVTFSGEMDKTYIGAEFSLKVHAYGVQSANVSGNDVTLLTVWPEE